MTEKPDTTSIPCNKDTRKRLKVYKALNDLKTYDEALNALLDIVAKTRKI